MLERPSGGERVILVHVDFTQSQDQPDFSEFELLADTAGATVVDILRIRRDRPQAKYFVGTGKVEDLVAAVKTHQADVVIFNHALSPGQERNLEKKCEARVMDRTGLILDIFAQRARTFEGKLQVELAQLQHHVSRLVRGWTHLERQKGGIGLRGPGETQLEVDRRLIRLRIKALQQRLKKVRSTRALGRQSRNKADCPTVALVGYTNAGKSTLFNQLVGESVFVADQLFATLDPTLRRLEIPNVGAVVLADTVGFIRDLPHDLVNAFAATLEETKLASVLLHVVDASCPDHLATRDSVNKVLEEIGAADVRQIEIYNKIDQIPHSEPHIDTDDLGQLKRVWVSAASGAGLDLLREVLGKQLKTPMVEKQLVLSVTQSQIRAKLYDHGAVLDEQISPDGDYLLSIRCPEALLKRILS